MKNNRSLRRNHSRTKRCPNSSRSVDFIMWYRRNRVGDASDPKGRIEAWERAEGSPAPLGGLGSRLRMHGILPSFPDMRQVSRCYCMARKISPNRCISFGWTRSRTRRGAPGTVLFRSKRPPLRVTMLTKSKDLGTPAEDTASTPKRSWSIHSQKRFTTRRGFRAAPRSYRAPTMAARPSVCCHADVRHSIGEADFRRGIPTTRSSMSCT